MRAKNELKTQLEEIVFELGYTWPAKVSLEPPKDKKFGDLAVNLALLLAKESGKNPRELALIISEKLKKMSRDIATAEVAGPGFINITYSSDFWNAAISNVLEAGDRFGSSNTGKGKKVQVEYVSANPTGPLHIGHGRGAALGDSLVRIMRFAGFAVEAEYYINDAGKQMRMLGLSIWTRAREIAGLQVEWPEDWYKGGYIKDMARELLEKQPELLRLPDETAKEICFEYGMREILAGIKSDLENFRVQHDVWFSESSLVSSGAVDKAFAELTRSGHTMENDGAFWFKTASMGDGKDRVLRKSDGSLTYFASDIAYHSNKYDRGFELVIDIWGADHHGYVPRMRAAVKALGKSEEAFEVILVQMVNLTQNGEQVAMSTRAGKFETLIDVIREVGTDAARFMFLSRKSDSQLDFDLELVKQRSMDNPVYYVQYAHARICAVLRKAEERGIKIAPESAGEFSAYLVEEIELALLRELDEFTELVASSAQNLAPHHVSYYLMELARTLHAYYAGIQVLNAKNDQVVRARLYLLTAVKQVLKNGLALLGVNAPESM